MNLHRSTSTKTVALFGVLIAAKLLTISGRDIPWTVWTPLALFWQDAAVALFFAAFDCVTRRRPSAGWILYGAIAVYAAFNVPVARILSSPFTWQMAHATGGALADSIMLYFTPATFAQIFIVLAATALLPFAAKQLKPVSIKPVLASLTALTVIGAVASARVDCSGYHRNALIAFAESTLPRVRGSNVVLAADWEKAVAGNKSTDDMTYLRGALAGRNVVLISLESTGAEYLKCYGSTNDPTPHLTALSQDAIVFDNAYAVTPESIKGLFSVLCSRYPAFDTQGEDYGNVRTPAIAEQFQDAGYRTALFHSGRFMYLGMDAVVRDRGFEVLEDAGAIGGNFNSSFGVDEPATVERMLQWIDSLESGDRFFLNYLPIAGHHPYATPVRGPFSTGDDAGQYLNALHYGDAALGDFLTALRERGLDSNTVFVVYGDHGEAFGQHEGNFGHTLFIYEENVRVPLLIAAPGIIVGQRRVSHIASLVDVSPTILDLTGMIVPPDYQGFSLLEPRSRPALFFTDYSLPLVGVRDGRWKLIGQPGANRAKLFDLEADPRETVNLAEQHPEFVSTWQRRLDNWASMQKALVQNSRTGNALALNRVGRTGRKPHQEIIPAPRGERGS